MYQENERFAADLRLYVHGSLLSQEWWQMSAGRVGLPRSRYLCHLLAGTCFLAGAAACGGSGEAADAADGGSQVTLADLLGLGDTRADLAARVRDTDRQRQEIIRECMASQGFEFVVHVVVGQVENSFGLPTDLSDDEFRQQHGYGLATGFEAAVKSPPDSMTGVPDDDPNASIVASMSDTERSAYERALHGNPEETGEPGGCEGEAIEATDRVGAFVERFGDELADLQASVDADPRVVDAHDAWVTCMEEAGYPYPDEQAIHDEILRRLNRINDAMMGDDVPEGVIMFEPGMTLSEDQSARLAEIVAFELAVANADQACRGDLDDIRREVQAQHEADFVDTHRDDLRDVFPDAGL